MTGCNTKSLSQKSWSSIIDSQKLLSEPRRAVQPRRQQALNSCPLRDLPGGLGDRLSWVGSGRSLAPLIVLIGNLW